MSIHGLLMSLSMVFRGGNALKRNAKHFVFDLPCDVTCDIGFNLISSRAIHFRFNFSATSIGYRDSMGALRLLPPPPPPPAEDRGRTRPSRARVKVIIPP